MNFKQYSGILAINIHLPILFVLSFGLFGFHFEAHSQDPVLSPKSSVSIITCGPGPSLYEAFGHSAIRVVDSLKGMDLMFNYGVFDFNQPNFYGNFAKGYMRYMLGVSPTEEFLFQYKYYKRSVREQVLNLDSSQKQAILTHLSINLKPENREYYYAYFDNNCSTKIIELLDSALSKKVIWQSTSADGEVSYRSLIHQYTVFQPWGRLGIDVGLGSLIDKPILGRQFDFLPDFVERDINRARIGNEVTAIPLVSQSRTLYESDYFFGKPPIWMHPGFVFSLILLISVFGFFYFPFGTRAGNLWSALLLISTGLLGWVVTSIWFFTNHIFASWNYNILWANPLFLFVGIGLIWKPAAFRSIASGIFVYLAAILLLWFVLPQEMNVFLLPLVGALLVSFWKREKSESLTSAE
jgi:hypothetical protein